MKRPMSRVKTAFALLVVFFAGCAAQRLVAVAPAHAGTPPQRWEYTCQRADEDITKMANRFGAEGWELVAAAGAGSGTGFGQHETMVWCFKRPLP
jgi:hypothetical protein